MIGLIKYMLKIPTTEVLFSRRGFRVNENQPHLENIGGVFLKGYYTALKIEGITYKNCDHYSSYLELLNEDPNYQGFAVEGAAMALALIDNLTFFKSDKHKTKWKEFTEEIAAKHLYVCYVGFGWALARSFWRIEALDRVVSRLNPYYRWLAIDGLGFHEGYFKFRHCDMRRVYNRPANSYFSKAFDQGLGRSTWFSFGADPIKIIENIKQLSFGRQGDFWSGIGLACVYAESKDPDAWRQLVELSGEYRSQLAQGAAFGVEARVRGNICTAQTELLSKGLCGLNIQETVQVVGSLFEEAKKHAPPEAVYEIWRVKLHVYFEEKLNHAEHA